MLKAGQTTGARQLRPQVCQSDKQSEQLLETEVEPELEPEPASQLEPERDLSSSDDGEFEDCR